MMELGRGDSRSYIGIRFIESSRINAAVFAYRKSEKFVNRGAQPTC
jgi:hypothetical protein